MERELVQKYFENGSDFFTVTEIKEHIEKMSSLKTNMRILGIEMKGMYKKIIIRGIRGYRLKKIYSDMQHHSTRELPY